MSVRTWDELLDQEKKKTRQAKKQLRELQQKKLWFCFRGPYDTSAWATLWDKKKLLEFFKDHEVVAPLLAKHPKFETLRVEVNRGEADDDGRVYIWGEDEPGSEGPDTQHEGTLVYIDGKLVYNDSRFVDTEDDTHEASDCEMCQKPE